MYSNIDKTKSIGKKQIGSKVRLLATSMLLFCMQTGCDLESLFPKNKPRSSPVASKKPLKQQQVMDDGIASLSGADSDSSGFSDADSDTDDGKELYSVKHRSRQDSYDSGISDGGDSGIDDVADRLETDSYVSGIDDDGCSGKDCFGFDFLECEEEDDDRYNSDVKEGYDSDDYMGDIEDNEGDDYNLDSDDSEGFKKNSEAESLTEDFSGKESDNSDFIFRDYSDTNSWDFDFLECEEEEDDGHNSDVKEGYDSDGYMGDVEDNEDNLDPDYLHNLYSKPKQDFYQLDFSIEDESPNNTPPSTENLPLVENSDLDVSSEN